MLRFGVEKSLSQHIGIVSEALILLMHMLDMLGLLLLKLPVLQCLILEVVDFSLQVHNLLVLLDLELLRIDLVFEDLELAHHHAHVPTVGAQEVFLVL